MIVDLRMPYRNGADIIEHVLGANVLVNNAYPSDLRARRALDAGAKGLLKKPFEVAKILEYMEG